MGRAAIGELAWRALPQADADTLLALLDSCMKRDYPLILVPHHLHPSESALVRMDGDRIEIADEFERQPNRTGDRMLSLALPLIGVVQ
jgi:hypothetical protein